MTQRKKDMNTGSLYRIQVQMLTLQKIGKATNGGEAQPAVVLAPTEMLQNWIEEIEVVIREIKADKCDREKEGEESGADAKESS